MSDTGYPDPSPFGPDASRLVQETPPADPVAPDLLPPAASALAHPASQDAELSALVVMTHVLEPLSPAARRRVLRWAAERYTQPGVSASGS